MQHIRPPKCTNIQLHVYREHCLHAIYHSFCSSLSCLTISAESKITGAGITALIIHVFCKYTFVSIHCTYVAHLLLTTNILHMYTHLFYNTYIASLIHEFNFFRTPTSSIYLYLWRCTTCVGDVKCDYFFLVKTPREYHSDWDEKQPPTGCVCIAVFDTVQ